MKIWLALHEERYPFAAFFTEEEAIAWVREREEDEFTFEIHQLDISKPENNRAVVTSAEGSFRANIETVNKVIALGLPGGELSNPDDFKPIRLRNGEPAQPYYPTRDPNAQKDTCARCGKAIELEQGILWRHSRSWISWCGPRFGASAGATPSSSNVK